MSASKMIKLFSRDQLWVQAQSKWPGKIRRRAFERTRERAIIQTGARAWSEPGRPKGKSKHP